MEHYVGLDVSLKQTSICVVNQAGSVQSLLNDAKERVPRLKFDLSEVGLRN
jgi:hypothetical protein